MERNEVLNLYLADLRRSAKLSVAQVCLNTKIQARFVEAMEAGNWSELPSNTHLRAFSVALATACGGDAAHAAALARRVLSLTAPVAPEDGKGSRGFDTPPPAPSLAGDAPPQGVPAFSGGPAVLASAGGAPSLGGNGLGASSLAAASVRLRSLPLSVLLSLLALAGTLSYGAAWSLEHWRRHEVSEVLGAQAAAEAGPAAAGSAAPVSTGPVRAGTVPAGPAASRAEAPAAAKASAPASDAAQTGLALRARRACWLVLEVDGKRLPIITMQDGDKLSWDVSQRAVLLAGNVGALRVWWQGDNLGYLGGLDQRANALVFEPGQAPHLDPSAALPLPAGIPQ